VSASAGLVGESRRATLKRGAYIMTALKSKLSLDATKLKIIAIVLMVFDHIHQMFAPVGAPIWLTWLGRPVMVMFLFAMSESFHYTRNRWKYLSRLFFGSCFMTVFSVILETLILPNDDVVLMNNAFGTFLVAGLYMLFWDMLVDGIKNKKAGKIIGSILLCFVPVLTAVPGIVIAELDISPMWVFQVLLTSVAILPNILAVEGGPLMVVMGVLLYVFRNRRWAQTAVIAAFSALVFVTSRDPSNQWLMIFAVIPILLYNGEKGRGMKYFFYIFYPAHIYMLYIIATLA
jgi:hypothetical protein